MDMNDVNIFKIVKKKVSFTKKRFKYFLGYNDDKIEPVYNASKNEWIC